jgi:hypothetical protein
MIASDFDCENHAGVRAAALCAVCLKPICGDCAIEEERELFCEDLHRTFSLTHERVATFSSPFEADAVVTNLKSNGVEAQRFFFRDHLSVVLSGQRDSATVYVERGKLAAATRTLNALQLLS